MKRRSPLACFGVASSTEEIKFVSDDAEANFHFHQTDLTSPN